MSKLPVLSGKELCKLLQLVGFLFDNQTGSHIILRNDNYPFRRLTVPNHREISKGTLRNIIREAGLSLDEFIDLI